MLSPPAFFQSPVVSVALAPHDVVFSSHRNMLVATPKRSRVSIGVSAHSIFEYITPYLYINIYVESVRFMSFVRRLVP